MIRNTRKSAKGSGFDISQGGLRIAPLRGWQFATPTAQPTSVVSQANPPAAEPLASGGGQQTEAAARAADNAHVSQEQ